MYHDLSDGTLRSVITFDRGATWNELFLTDEQCRGVIIKVPTGNMSFEWTTAHVVNTAHTHTHAHVHIYIHIHTDTYSCNHHSPLTTHHSPLTTHTHAHAHAHAHTYVLYIPCNLYAVV